MPDGIKLSERSELTCKGGQTMAKIKEKKRKQTGSGGKKSKSGHLPASAEKKLKYLRVILLAAICIVAFYPPYLRGLFFENEQFPTEIFVFTAFAVFWIYKAVKKDGKFLETPVDYASFGFVIVYLLSLLAAVALRYAISEWLKYCMYFAVFFMLSELTYTYKSKIVVLWVIIASAAGVSILGIDGAAGGSIANALNGFFKSMGAGDEVFFELFKGDRIYSTLQYPNALAAYLMAAYFICTGLMMVSRKLWVKMTAGITGFLFLVTFVFTLSRGAYLMFPAAAVVLLIALPNGSRVKAVVSALASMIPAAVISVKLSGYMTGSAENAGIIWKYILIGMVLSAVLAFVFNYAVKWLEGISWKIYAGIIAAAVIVLAAGTLFALSSSVPLELTYTADNTAGMRTLRKSAILKPGTEYKLVFDVDAPAVGENAEPYRITFANKTKAEIILGRETRFFTYAGTGTKGTEKREIKFKVPDESSTVNIYFSTPNKGSKAVFDNAAIVDEDTGKTVEKLVLKYKYLPYSITSRFEDIKAERSGIVRGIFYKDGVDIFKERWFLGGGGSAWAFLYFAHQSYYYTTTQAHNYLLQIAVECGVIGIAVLLLLIVSVVVMFIHQYRLKTRSVENEKILQSVLFASIIALIMHSAIDFDFSLSAVFLLLWELTALFNAGSKEAATGGQQPAAVSKANLPGKVKGFFKGKYKTKVHPAAGFLLTVIILIFPILFLTALNYANAAVKANESKNSRLAIEDMKKAGSVDPFAAQYKIDYANLMAVGKQINQSNINTVNKRMSTAEKLAEYDARLLPKIGSYYLSTGGIEKGLSFFDRTVQLRPLNPKDWANRINAYAQVVFFYFQEKDMNKAFEYTDKTLSIMNEAKEANKNNLDPFILDANTMELLERLKYVKDLYGRTEAVDISKVVFCSMPEMDIDSDGVPDQWKGSVSPGMNLSCGDGSVIVENTAPEEIKYVRSRALNLQPGKDYIITVELADNQGIDAIPFMITGVNKRNESLKPSGNVFTAGFSTAADFKSSNNLLRLVAQGKYEIKGINILEK